MSFILASNIQLAAEVIKLIMQSPEFDYSNTAVPAAWGFLSTSAFE